MLADGEPKLTETALGQPLCRRVKRASRSDSSAIVAVLVSEKLIGPSSNKTVTRFVFGEASWIFGMVWTTFWISGHFTITAEILSCAFSLGCRLLLPVNFFARQFDFDDVALPLIIAVGKRRDREGEFDNSDISCVGHNFTPVLQQSVCQLNTELDFSFHC
jgi:hypothetical protein